MKVVIVNQHQLDALGGSEIQCNTIASEFKRLGLDVHYIAVGGRADYTSLSYPVVPVRKNADAILAAILALKPDVVYWRFNKKHFLPVAKGCKSKGIKFVFSVSAINDVRRWGVKWGPSAFKSVRGVWSLLRGLASSVWQHQGFRYVDALVSLNADYLHKVPVPKQMYIPNTMPTESVAFSWSKPFVIWVANIKSCKRPEACVNLAKKLLADGIDVLMVGKLQDSNYDWLSDNAKLPVNFHYLGPKTVYEVNGIIQTSIALVHTCVPEGFGNNYIQAWLNGKPTVSLEFDPGGLIRSQNMGLVSNADEEVFYHDVKKIVSSESLRIELGNNAKAYATTHFSVTQNVSLLSDFISQVLRKTH